MYDREDNIGFTNVEVCFDSGGCLYRIKVYISTDDNGHIIFVNEINSGDVYETRMESDFVLKSEEQLNTFLDIKNVLVRNILNSV